MHIAFGRRAHGVGNDLEVQEIIGRGVASHREAPIAYRTRRLDDEGQRQMALRAALAVTNSDEITRRATLIQREAPTRRRLRLGNAKAN